MKDETFRRKHQYSFSLNDHEDNALNYYCRKYKIKNKSKFLRKAIMERILQDLENDHPTLFTDEEMQRLTDNTQDNP